eukprot:c9565_g1_i1.p1 GENE.c9565_g1_i1~~c9565_g1_i1.p1  ORF type:complete len:512 (-),score=123.36 c9565_g1_i1:319-1854(-)
METFGLRWIFCAAGSIGDLMQICCRTLSEEEIRRVCVGILRALVYLHDNNKIHRDIKAGNVLLDDEGNIKVADFGVSAQLKDTWGKRQSVIGTPYWMAPEVLKEVPYNFKADIWSFGVTCIEMAQGQPPLAGVHPMRVIFLIPSSSPPGLSDPSRWSPQFANFIAQCVQHDPSIRPSAQDLLNHEFISGYLDQPAPTVKNLVSECLGQIDKYRKGDGDKDDGESLSVSSDGVSDDETTTSVRGRTNTVVTTSSKGTINALIHVEAGRDAIIKDGTFSRTLVMRQIRQQVQPPVLNLPPLPPPPPAVFATPRKVAADATSTKADGAATSRSTAIMRKGSNSSPDLVRREPSTSSTHQSILVTSDRTIVSPAHRLAADETIRKEEDSALGEDDFSDDDADASRVPVQHIEESIVEITNNIKEATAAASIAESTQLESTSGDDAKQIRRSVGDGALTDRSVIRKKHLDKLAKLYLAHPDRTRAWTLLEGAIDWATVASFAEHEPQAEFPLGETA